MEGINLSSNLEKDIHNLAEDLRDDDFLTMMDVQKNAKEESSPNWEKLVSDALGLTASKKAPQ